MSNAMVCYSTLIGVVLAGGRSSRMGRDKALLPWGEGTLLNHAVALMHSAGVETVKVSGDRPGFDCLPDTTPGAGPGVAISDLLASLPADAAVLVVPVDMPLLTPALLARLASVSGRAAYFEGFPLPALLPTRGPEGQPLRADALRRLHAQAASQALPLTEDEAAAFVNVNTPQEWNELERT
jgi:molybdopterin-guanine dinucleotide biosynthesis protein A